MVNNLPFNQWGASQPFPRVRPGIAISIAFHAALLLCLAYALSFGPRPLPETIEGPVITVLPQPDVQPPPPQPVKSDIHPKRIEPQKFQTVNIPPLPIPPDPPQATDNATKAEPTRNSAPVVIDPVPISRGGLVYPDKAVDQGINGYVDFNFVIEPDGSVGDTQVIAEMPQGYGFAAAARKGFQTWKFQPKIVDGTAIAAPARIRVSFKLK